MLKLSTPQLGDETLFEATLEPTASTVDKLVKRKDMGEGKINTILGKKNKVAVGTPYYENLILRLVEEKEEIPNEIKQMSYNYDFHIVSLSCSFLPDSESRFIWARFGVELGARSKYGELLTEKPIAYDMFPDEVLSEIKYRREVKFGPELKFNLGVISADMVYGVSESRELVIYEPQIFAFGIRRPSVAWNFKSTKEKGIWGNKRDLLLIVRAPKNSRVKGRFLLAAEVEVNIGIGKWIRIPLSRRKDKVVDAEYDLSA